MTTSISENNFTQIIFIDGYESYIDTVIKQYTNREIKCYLFERRKN